LKGRYAEAHTFLVDGTDQPLPESEIDVTMFQHVDQGAFVSAQSSMLQVPLKFALAGPSRLNIRNQACWRDALTTCCMGPALRVGFFSQHFRRSLHPRIHTYASFWTEQPQQTRTQHLYIHCPDLAPCSSQDQTQSRRRSQYSKSALWFIRAGVPTSMEVLCGTPS